MEASRRSFGLAKASVFHEAMKRFERALFEFIPFGLGGRPPQPPASAFFTRMIKHWYIVGT